MNKKHPLWMYILFPSISMLLGWGLRGYIGGGPFGAMIPGALVALCIAMLLELSVEAASVLVVFGAVGIGIGGEMTYGQTLGFLKNPDTMWWGTLGTTVKGAVWGMLGGLILAMGMIVHRLTKKTVIVAFLMLFAGMMIGFKLINQPMLIYFSDPVKPRPESWGALLIGAIAMLVYLKSIIDTTDFKILSRISLCGLIGGGLGFGLGGFWMVMGSRLPVDVIFQSWWKAMEFTFGMILGAGLGLAVWLNRKDFDSIRKFPSAELFFSSNSVWKDFVVTFALAFLIFWVLPNYLDPIVDVGYVQGKFTWIGFVDFVKILSNFVFYGSLLILTVLYFPKLAWQIGITLTFCYAAIDLMQDVYPNASTDSPFTLYFLLIFLMNLVVALSVAWFQRNTTIIRNMFLLLVWSCMVVAYIRLGIFEKPADVAGLSLCGFICGKFFVHITFALSALIITWISALISRSVSDIHKN